MRPTSDDTMTHAVTAGPAGIASEISQREIAAEWRRRAGRDGLARVMRASQPAELNCDVTTHTLAIVARHLDTAATMLGRPIDTALEVGCGIGRVTPTVAVRADQVLALDICPEMLEAARHSCADLDNVEFTHRGVEDLPGTGYDVVVCVWVLMHVLDPRRLETACRAVARAASHLVLVEYEHAAMPVGRFTRLRSLPEYLRLLPGSRLVQCEEVDYGGDRSFAALIALDQAADLS